MGDHPTQTAPTQTALKEPPPAPRREPPPKPRSHARRFVRSHRRGLLWSIPILVAIGVGASFLMRYLASYESTDDAQIDGHINPISTRVPGTVVAVYVENNQFVHAGELLVELDPKDYQVALERAQATYSQAQAQIQVQAPAVPITQTTTTSGISSAQSEILDTEAGVAVAERDYQARLATLQEAQATNTKLQTDVKRYEPLVAQDEIPRQTYDAAVAAAQSQAAAVDAARASSEAARQALEQRRAQLAQAQVRLTEAQQNAPRQVAASQASVTSYRANSLQAKAALDEAALELSYTKIYAPVDGVVASRSAEVGARVQPGEQLLAVSQIDDIWVTANFKETQLKSMRPGQSTDIHVDAFDAMYQGYVEDMPGASGAVTSLLPPQNATGNYVKVVQRLPVRIRFKPNQDQQHRLRIGMSVEPKVWLNSNTNPPPRG